MPRLFHPHLRLQSVVELTPGRLGDLGIKSLLLDVDCTLKHYRSRDLTPEIAQWLETMKMAGVGLCLVSNGRGARIRTFAESVGIPFVAPAMKPLPFGCRKAIQAMGFDKSSTAMVGDQVFADLLAGKWAGLFTVLVTPLSPEEEPWFARMKRPLEKLVLPREEGVKNPGAGSPKGEKEKR